MNGGRPATPAVHYAGDTPCFHPAFFVELAHHSSMPLYRATWTWSGFPGAPGYTTFHFLDPDPISESGINQTALRARNFWEAVDGLMPSTVKIDEPQILEEIDTATGTLIQELSWPGGSQMTGAMVGKYSSAVGAAITWNTVGVINGRRLRGRTFLVPMGMNSFETDGTLGPTERTTILNAGNALADASVGLGIDLAVWHRPTSPGGTDGAAAGVTGCTVKDKTAVLRSRRD